MKSQNEEQVLPPKFYEFVKYFDNNELSIQSINQSEKLIEVWKFFKEIKCKRISCGSLKSFQNIIQDISHINFPNLKFLSLWNCQIMSLEGISQINAPNLQELFLSGNKLTKMKNLSKGNFKKLWRLSIHENMITDGESIVNAGFRITHLSYDLINQHKCQCECVSWLAKYETNFQCLWVQSDLRIVEKNLRQKIELKNQKMAFYGKKQ